MFFLFFLCSSLLLATFCPLQIMEGVWALTPTLSEMKDEITALICAYFAFFWFTQAKIIHFTPRFRLIIHLLLKGFWKVKHVQGFCTVTRHRPHLQTVFSINHLAYKVSENGDAPFEKLGATLLKNHFGLKSDFSFCWYSTLLFGESFQL